MFENLITSQHKEIFNQAIDAILAKNALSIPCQLIFGENNTQSNLCNNCRLDPITQLSSNIYNGTGPVSFSEGQICPVCLGAGYTSSSEHTEKINLGVIFDSKYWLKTSSSDIVKIPDGMIQTICSSSLLTKIINAKYLVIDTSIQHPGVYSYERDGDPNPCGFGDTNYIFTMWKRK